MGDIAEMMLDGTLDSQTGEFIDGNSPSYPRTMQGDHTKLNKFNGIKKFLTSKGIKVNQVNPIITMYSKLHNLSSKGSLNMANDIQEDFPKFAKWFNREFLNNKK